MNVRLLLTAGALSLGLGLSSAAVAQGMQPLQGQPGMEQGQMGDDMGQEQRPMKRATSKKKMKTSMKSQKTMRSKQQRMDRGSGMEQGGAGAAGAADDGM